MPIVDVPVDVHDARRAVPAPGLSEEGFVLVQHRSRVREFNNAEALETVYLPEAEALVRELTGAAHAWALPRPVLRSAQHEAAARPGVVHDGTAPVAHVDYSAASVSLLAAAAAARRGRQAPAWRRLLLFTVWRSLRPPPQDRPLALCDLRTLADRDLVAADAIANPGALAHEAEFLMLLPSPVHRWCYFSDMVPEEALVFQQLDSAAAGPSGCPHTSFALSASAAVPRLSIEARVCAFFE